MRLGSLRVAVLAGVGVLLLCILAAALTVGGTVPALRAAQSDRARSSSAADDSARLLGAFVDAETGVRGYVLTQQRQFLEPYVAAERSRPALVAKLRAEVSSASPAGRALTETVSAYDAWRGEYAERQLALVNGSQAAQARSLTDRGKQLFDTVRVQVAALQLVLRQQTAAADRRVRQREDQLTLLLFGSLVTLAALVVTGSTLLLRGVVRPLAQLADASRRTAPDQPVAPLRIGGPAEVRQVAADVGAMRARLAEEVTASRQAVEALTQQSPAVVALRDALRPGEHRVAGLDVAGRLDPAEGVLAGDWFDTVQVSDTTLALVLGDVAGHGAASAVFALRLKTSLAAALRAGRSPSQALRITAADLDDVAPEMFATVLVAVVDTVAGTLTAANAGHPAGMVFARPPGTPEVLRPGEQPTVLEHRADETVTWVELPATGPLLSPMVQSWAWGEIVHGFRDHDTLVAYTDGVIETRNSAGEQYGTERLMALLGRTEEASCRELVEAVAADIRAFAYERRPADDRTILCVRSDNPMRRIDR